MYREQTNVFRPKTVFKENTTAPNPYLVLSYTTFCFVSIIMGSQYESGMD